MKFEICSFNSAVFEENRMGFYAVSIRHGKPLHINCILKVFDPCLLFLLSLEASMLCSLFKKFPFLKRMRALLLVSKLPYILNFKNSKNQR